MYPHMCIGMQYVLTLDDGQSASLDIRTVLFYNLYVRHHLQTINYYLYAHRRRHYTMIN